MIRSRTLATLMTAGAAFALSAAAPLAAQSTGPVHLGYDSNAPLGTHLHEGELGEIALILERKLGCQCGSCALDVHSCQFQMRCGTAPAWSERIRRSLEEGQSPEALEASIVAEFGPGVLMSPPAEGFNLVGYLLPSVGIVTAGMLIGLFLRGRAAGRERPALGTELSNEDLDRLREALRRLDETEGPDW